MTKNENSLACWIPWMRRALQLAALAKGKTSPNPLVGAVVLDSNGILVGEGFHPRAGNQHAEVMALSQAADAADGGTLIVTLEPCCHQGRTAPCTEAVISAGITRVVGALQDPDPRVAGAGFARLKDAGLKVITGVLEKEAAYQNRAFIHRVTTGRPWGVLKWAMSLDGRTALPNGESQWITGLEARSWVHELRSECDAVLVGGGTVRADDPLLTSRGASSPEPIRVVFSKSLNLPSKAKLWDLTLAKTVIAYGPGANLESLSRLPLGPERLFINPSEPFALLQALAHKGCNQILWECGPSLASLAIKQDCVQELAVLLAPKLLGGLPARTALSDLGNTSLNQALLLQLSGFRQLGDDWLMKALLL